MSEWVANPPRLFDVVTGFFPEAKPKNGKLDPRPLLVTGVFQRDDGLVALRVAYGTSQTRKAEARGTCLPIYQSSLIDQLHLTRATAFLLTPGSAMRIMPWDEAHFAPWSSRRTPILGRLPEDMQAYVTEVVSHLPDLLMP